MTLMSGTLVSFGLRILIGLVVLFFLYIIIRDSF